MNSAPAALPVDWRLQIPEPRRRVLRAWLWSVALMTLGVLIVGGITRLTHSGLSIVEWDPLFGIVPPLGEAQWQELFAKYQQFPQYRQLNTGMTLEEFKFIFFWEYIHRVIARLIGVVFAVPFAFFALRRWFNRQLAWRAVLLFALGGMQGVMGWLMVASGLVDRPSVSHFRLAAHLSLAFLIFAYALWLVRELQVQPVRVRLPAATRTLLARWLAVTGVLLALQIVWGAFVAGLRAGLFFPTFPLMGGRWIPANLLVLEPALYNFVQHPVAVQWTHRVLGTVLALAVLALFFRAWSVTADPASRRYAALFAGLTLLQYTLGVLTLVLHVPVSVAVIHQAMAMVLFGTWVTWVHHLKNTEAVR